MPFNGNGVFQRIYSWTNDKDSGIKVRADRMDNEMNGMATGLSNCITKDGQTTVTANLPMASNRHLNVGDATDRDEYASFGQLQDSKGNYASSVGGTADVITLSFAPSFQSYFAGQKIRWVSSGANTTNVTVNVDALGAKAVTKFGATALVAGDIPASAVIEAVYDGTQFQLVAVRGVGLTENNTFSGDNTFTGKILTPSDGTLTIATGAITVTGAYHLIDTEASAASDDLDTINGGAAGQILVLRTNADARDVVIKNNTGNILTATGADITLNSTNETISLKYDGGKSKWLVIGTGLTLPSQTGNSGKVLTTNGTVASWGDVWTYGTNTATTSGAAVVLTTAIPTTATEFEVLLDGVGGSAANTTARIELGDAGGYETSGYSGALAFGATVEALSSGVNISDSGTDGTDTVTGVVSFKLKDVTSNTWTFSGQTTRFVSGTATFVNIIAGQKATSQTLDSVRLTFASGAFDAGSARVRWR